MASAPAVRSTRSARRGSALTADERDEVGDIVATARERHPVGDLGRSTMPWDGDDALEILDTLWHTVIDALAAAPLTPTGSHSSDVELLSRVKSVITRIQAGQVERVDSALASLRNTIAELDEIDDAAHLLDRAAVATTTLGFDRAMISSLSDGTWVPVAGHIERDPVWASEIVAAGQAHPEIIDAALPEAEVIRSRRAILVDDVGKLPRCYATIIEISKGQRYVAAPIVANRTVIGFVHADAFYRTRRFTNTDIRLLGLFGEFLGRTMSRVTMLNELQALRGEVGYIDTRIAELERTWSGQPHRSGRLLPPLGPAPARSTHAQRPSGPAGAANALTRRELEVLELVAEGATNARIARALTISAGTVKGHMKH
ncbi:MAG: LuxR C-terminal-related transcriptional regulator, partial [Mycobacterium sp.]|nr:LuxR C-terminal-related transcriptional regulator [Mycobacterium sp.]